MTEYLKHQEILDKCERLNKNYEVDPVFFDNIIDELLDSEMDTQSVILNGFKRLLSEVDHEIERMEDYAGMKASCFKGCAFCCYFPIIVTKMEAKMMLKEIEQFPEERKEKIYQHWNSYFDDHAGKLDTALNMDLQADETKLNYKRLDLPCPMLDPETKTCMAYEIRPIPCRTYLNYANPKVCAENHMPDEPFSYEFLYEYYMGALNEIMQALYENGEELFVDYPSDVWSYDYLPAWIKRRSEVESDAF
ncbi:Putative zinc-or iron-chelating domain-containing protein [Thalassobacillus cyri]|uniref:Putative zinc-or iron-chelating domain-containing protein n=1 Tax=Thalassobacillus cyri TaxID=571932 RepID=A0A1H3Z1V5_9BACI|nr:YkgJ family cysteine cluster protein [Thalassobacillus cyri]SEA17833.1 Putative zinc-or iron-chelating domain-containing protein [Thalassobacillus cyri]